MKPQRIIENYPGNKGVLGLYHLIINNFPPHKRFYELTAGSAEISRRKAPAEMTVVNDIEQSVYVKLLQYSLAHPELNWHAMNENCLNILTVMQQQGTKQELKETLCYIDLPYIGLKIYNGGHEPEFHQRVIQICSSLKCNIMFSHYEHPLYDNLVTNCGWRKEIFKTWYHKKHVTEAIYMNYPAPKKLQDYSLLGDDCWQRQGIKRKISRHVNRLLSLPPLEREAIIDAIKNSF